MSQLKWHSVSWQKVVEYFNSDEKKGLSVNEAEKRKEKYGKNILPRRKATPRWLIFLNQFKSPLIFILAVFGIVTLVLGKYTDGIVIWAAVLLNTFIGYFQENKATRALEELNKVLRVKARVLRDGNKIEVDQEELVPGDIIFITAGDKVPADARIIESWNFKVNEAVFTGEWISASKNADVLDVKTPLADRDNMIYMGTIAEMGEVKAVVVGTGLNTELGNIAVLIQEVEKEKTPYQQKLVRFSWFMAGIIGIITLFIFTEGVLSGREFIEMFTVSVAVAVAAIPEGLPVTITAILAMGMQRILKQKGLVRKLTSAETLGSASVIATDKTLTLTEGKMEVQEVFTLEEYNKEFALTISAFANEAFVENPDSPFEHWVIKGHPTDKALLTAAIEMGFSPKEMEKEMPLIERLPFDPIKKYIVSFHKKDGRVLAYISGSPESLISMSSNLTLDKKKKIEKKLLEFTTQGLRVVGVAFAELKDKKEDSFGEKIKNVDFVGLIAMRDPLRRGVKKTIAFTKQAGINVIMVTGDHIETARAVAKEVGIDGGVGAAIEGIALDKMSDRELEDNLEDIKIFARVEPRHKLRIIDAWQKKGEVIAMTGDGINDAPAIRKADIGIALGSGSDVAKEVADLVLLGDKFSIIPSAIREGRIIIENIRKVITYLLVSTFTEIILIGTSIVFALPLPITATQILWINLIVDGFPAIAFTFEKGEKGLMKRKPERKNAPLLTPPMKKIISTMAAVNSLFFLGLFIWLLKGSDYQIDYIRTFIFAALGISSLLFVFSTKNLHKNIWQYNPFSNYFLTGTVAAGFSLIFAAVYIPMFQNLFHTVSINPLHWIALFGFGLLNIALIDLNKWYFMRKLSRKK